jgi:hypothetical protein
VLACSCAPCVYVDVPVRVSVYALHCLCLCACLPLCACMLVPVCACVPVCLCLCACMCSCACACSVCMYVHVRVCAFVCVVGRRADVLPCVFLWLRGIPSRCCVLMGRGSLSLTVTVCLRQSRSLSMRTPSLCVCLRPHMPTHSLLFSFFVSLCAPKQCGPSRLCMRPGYKKKVLANNHHTHKRTQAQAQAHARPHPCLYFCPCLCKLLGGLLAALVERVGDEQDPR